MLPTRVSYSPSTSLIREALHANGPQTTRTLYALIQDEATARNTPLPPRSRPANFLQGHRRRILRSQQRPGQGSSLSSSSSSSAATTESTESTLPVVDRLAPGEGIGQNGWSMRYLKTKVLEGMHARGEVLKLTRSRWERAQALKEAQAKGQAADSTTTTTAAAIEEASSATAVKELHRHEEEHVWVTKDMWAPLKEVVKSRKETGERSS